MPRRKRDRKAAQGTLQADAYSAEDILSGAEPWDPIETKIVAWSFILAAVALVGFGIVINLTILAK